MARPGPEPANQASLAVSPSVLAQAALISHEGRGQFVCCLEHRKLNNPGKCGFPVLHIYSQTSLLPVPICGLNINDTSLSGSLPIAEGETKGSITETSGSVNTEESLPLGGLLFICVFIKRKAVNSVSYTFWPERKLAHLSLT